MTASNGDSYGHGFPAGGSRISTTNVEYTRADCGSCMKAQFYKPAFYMVNREENSSMISRQVKHVLSTSLPAPLIL